MKWAQFCVGIGTIEFEILSWKSNKKNLIHLSIRKSVHGNNLYMVWCGLQIEMKLHFLLTVCTSIENLVIISTFPLIQNFQRPTSKWFAFVWTNFCNIIFATYICKIKIIHIVSDFNFLQNRPMDLVIFIIKYLVLHGDDDIR